MGLVELVLDKISKPEVRDIAYNAIAKCWNWVENKQVSADEVYYFLENIDENDIMSYLQMEDDSKQECLLICTADALAYISYELYLYEKAEYMPETIESVDETTIQEFFDSFNKVYEYGGIKDDLKYFLIKQKNVSMSRDCIRDYVQVKIKEYQ